MILFIYIFEGYLEGEEIKQKDAQIKEQGEVIKQKDAKIMDQMKEIEQKDVQFKEIREKYSKIMDLTNKM